MTEVYLREDDSPNQDSDSAVGTRRNEGERRGGGREKGIPLCSKEINIH